MKHILIANRWRTPDGTLLESKHVHDYVSHDDANGDFYFVDGGHDYIRMSSNKIKMANECVYADDDFEKVRMHELRGAMTSMMEIRYVPLYKMSDQHVLNCITYNLKNIVKLERYEIHTHLYVKEMKYRIENDLFLDDCEYTKQYVEKAKPKYEQMLMRRNCPEDKNFCTTLEEIKEVLYESASSKDETHTSKTYFALNMLDSMFTDLEKEANYAFMG